MTRKHTSKAILIISIITLSYLLHKYIVSYEIYIAAAGFILYYIIKNILKLRHRSYMILDAGAFTFLVSVLIQTTGGISSPFFFLIYFLVCAIALIIDWPTALATSLGFICFFIFTMASSDIVTHLIPLGSIALLTPFAILLGQEHHKVLQEENKIHQMEKIQQFLQKENVLERKDTLLFVLKPIKTHLQALLGILAGEQTVDVRQTVAQGISRILALINEYEEKIKD